LIALSVYLQHGYVKSAKTLPTTAYAVRFAKNILVSAVKSAIGFLVSVAKYVKNILVSVIDRDRFLRLKGGILILQQEHLRLEPTRVQRLGEQKGAIDFGFQMLERL
jgi:hypothetical protein